MIKKDKKGIIIPLYSYPEPSMSYTRNKALKEGDKKHHGVFEWHTVLNLHQKYPHVPVIVIINPDSGPGELFEQRYKVGAIALKEAGITVVGYVSTKYAGMSSSIGLPQYPLSAVKEDIDLWYRYYPMIDGLFFDEMAKGFDPEVLNYYARIRDLARSRGAGKIIMNPGSYINHRWYKHAVADLFITWERDAYPVIADMITEYDFDKRQSNDFSALRSPERGCLIIGQKIKSYSVKWVLKPYFDWIYITPKPLEPNPWDRVDPAALEKLFRLLSR
jgi:hypothetical protein